ncbi:MAG: radical SAM family heme chaperone HemW [Pseudomonadales bacterium]
MTRPVGLYVHFPWCVRKCPYCDFNSHPLRGELPMETYTDALIRDLSAQLVVTDGARIRTVFFGGGTPSLFPPVAFERLLGFLAPWLEAHAEITLEANPGTTEHGDLAGYRTAGINRLSFGAQSFSDAHLAALGRIHDSGAIYRSFELARAAGFDNVNLDLMYGLPKQTRAQAMADLDAAIALAPEHLSWYQLTLEPKTEFARRPPPLPSDVMLAATEDAGYARLDAAGFARYEVSAFARDGRESRHNLGYWTFADYLGAGAGAHGKLTASPATVQRTRKAHQPRLYLADPETTEITPVPARALPGEFMLNALRLTSGVALERFEATTGLPLTALEPARSRQIDAGLLEAGRLAATPRGFALLDSLIQDYL